MKGMKRRVPWPPRPAAEPPASLRQSRRELLPGGRKPWARNEGAMTFHALLVSLDDNSARILVEVFDEFFLGPERCSHADAAPKFEDQRFDVIAIDLDDALTPDCIADVRRSSRGKTSLILGLLSHPDQL